MLFIFPVLLAMTACSTVPDSAVKAAAGAAQETAPREAGTAAAPAAKPDAALAGEEKTAAAPRYLLTSVHSYLANGVLDTVTTMVYRDGKLVAEQISFADGSPAGQVSHRYEGGLLASSVKTDRFGAVTSARAFDYDGSRILVREAFLDANGNPIFAHRYFYDSNKRRSKLQIVSSDGLVLGWSEYSYEDGRNDRVEIFDSAGELQEYLERSYDEKGRPVLEVLTATNGKELERVKYTYLGDALAGKETYILTVKTGSETYRYDDNGYLAVKSRYDRTGKLIEIIEYRYTEATR